MLLNSIVFSYWGQIHLNEKKYKYLTIEIQINRGENHNWTTITIIAESYEEVTSSKNTKMNNKNHKDMNKELETQEQSDCCDQDLILKQ